MGCIKRLALQEPLVDCVGSEQAREEATATATTATITTAAAPIAAAAAAAEGGLFGLTRGLRESLSPLFRSAGGDDDGVREGNRHRVDAEGGRHLPGLLQHQGAASTARGAAPLLLAAAASPPEASRWQAAKSFATFVLPTAPVRKEVGTHIRAP